jgi:uncharacterized protein YndB with AHSA1/START domain
VDARNDKGFRVAASGDFDIVMTRVFDAPRRMVFDAFTKPELVKRWLLGPDGWTMPVCELDPKPGGRIRYLWRRDKDGSEMGMHGTFREVTAPERTVHGEQFDDPWYPGEAMVTTLFAENGGKTTVTMTMHMQTREARDGVLQSGMESGVARSYERLDDVLISVAA